MKSRERILNTLTGKNVDRAPLTAGMGMWGETHRRWLSEGMDGSKSIEEIFGLDEGFRHISDFSAGVRLGLCPWFDSEIIAEKERSVIRRDIYGIIREDLKGEFGESLANYLEYPVTDRESWERVKGEKLQFDIESRIPKNINEIAESFNNGNHSVVLGEYPYGLFGTCRDLMGVENLCIACCEEPELISDMMSHLTSLWLRIYGEIVKYIKVDSVHIWEDMSGKQGSLISPDMVKHFMLPNYRRISEFCKTNGIEVLSVDTDGSVTELVPLFMSAGVNFIFPFEVAAGSDILHYRKMYPELAIMGGIDKRELAKSKKEIDAQMEIVDKMLSYGRYIPSVDHLVHPEVSWENFSYYINALKETVFGKAK